MTKVDVSIILACYDEGSSFKQSVKKIVSNLNKLKKTWEIIFVEDKSTDNTRRSVEELTKQLKNSRAIYHQSNLGRGKTVSDGIRVASGVICGYLDVDLEVSADYIPLFINEINNGADMVIGKRFYEGQGSFVRFLASKVYAQIVRFILKIPIEDTEAGYKFFKRSKILPILSKIRDRKWFWDTEICALAYYAGLKITFIPVLFIRRHDKKSTVKLIPDTWAYLTKILKFRSENANLIP